MSNTKQRTVYALRLQDGFYYVGQTDRTVEQRFWEHQTGYGGSAWSKLHQPIKVIQTIKDAHELDEQHLTQKYMARYGVDKVRGGKYNQIVFDRDHAKSIVETQWASKDCCFKCGLQGHFTTSCKGDGLDRKEQLIQHIMAGGNFSNFVYERRRRERSRGIEQGRSQPWQCRKSIVCQRCGYRGHQEATCYKQVDINGDPISQDQSEDESDGQPVCYKCGRPGHYANTCFARRHVNGYSLR